ACRRRARSSRARSFRMARRFASSWAANAAPSARMRSGSPPAARSSSSTSSLGVSGRSGSAARLSSIASTLVFFSFPLRVVLQRGLDAPRLLEDAQPRVAYGAREQTELCRLLVRERLAVHEELHDPRLQRASGVVRAQPGEHAIVDVLALDRFGQRARV